MITPQVSPRTDHEYLVYDLEWVPHTLEIRMAGVFDGKRYRWYTTIAAFIAGELTSKNRGRRFYAHAGGLADFQFVLEALLPDEYQIEASFSGSSAIIVHVRRGKNVWHFIDSYWLLRDSLRNIGKWIGIAKGNVEQSESWYATVPIAELRDYNEIDCVILYRAIAWFADVLHGLGGELRMTVASCAMDLFRRQFLRDDIGTSMRVNDITRLAYFSARVEPYHRDCETANYYDINSSFPHAMTSMVPGDLIASYRGRLPRLANHFESGSIYFADVEIESPEDSIPPLPIRVDGRLFFPTGPIRGWYSSVDLALLVRAGGRINRVYESLEFDPRDDLAAYATTIYGLRERAEGFERIVLKYLLNSLYGKFAETDVKRSMIVNPDTPGPIESMLLPGVFVLDKIVPVPHMHVPISAHITAVARESLYNHMKLSSEVYYCDCDGFATPDLYIEGTGLGSLKLEKRIVRGEFLAPKVYDLELGDGTHITRAKGFSRMTYERFVKLRDGEELEMTRMRRILELMRRGIIDGRFQPREETIRKRLRGGAIDKRFFYPDGHSRPWHTSELLRER